MYIDRSLLGDPKKDKCINELNFKKCMCFNMNTTSNFFVDITVTGRRFIIHAEYFDAKNIFSHQFPHNIKYRPNIFQDLSKPTRKALLKQIFKYSDKQQVHKIQRITSRNGKIK